MEKYRTILGGTGGGSSDGVSLPGNVVSEVPAGAQFVLSHHWIHYGDEPADVQAMLVTIPPESEHDLVIARSLSVTGLGWKLLPGVATEHTVECTFEQDVPMLATMGHEHEWGTWVKAERIAPDGSVDVIFDHAYVPEYAANAKLFYYPLEMPWMFRMGDRVRFTCQWMNNTADAIEFPREMCVFFGYTTAATDLTCVNGNWLARP